MSDRAIAKKVSQSTGESLSPQTVAKWREVDVVPREESSEATAANLALEKAQELMRLLPYGIDDKNTVDKVATAAAKLIEKYLALTGRGAGNEGREAADPEEETAAEKLILKLFSAKSEAPSEEAPRS